MLPTLRSWLGRTDRTAPTPARRLAVEHLEDRLVPTGLPPVILISGPPTVAENMASELTADVYRLDLTAADPEGDPVTGWTINWGDGTTDTLTGNPRTATHTYATGPAVRNITASAVVGGETFAATVAGGAWASLGTIAGGGGQSYLGHVLFGPDVTGPGGTPDGVQDVYATGFDTSNVAVYDGATGAYARTLMTAADGLSLPSGAVFGPDGNLYVSSQGTNRVLRYDFATDTVSEYLGASSVHSPMGLTFGPDGDLYVAQYLADTPTPREILRFDAVTGQRSVFNEADDGYVWYMKFRPDGYLYIQTGFGVARYNAASGEFHDMFIRRGENGLDGPHGFDFGPDGDLYVGSYYNSKVLRYDSATGAFLGTVVSGGGLDRTADVRFGPDANGDGRADLYVSDRGAGGIIRRYTGPLTSTGATSLPVTVLDAVTTTYSSSPNAAIPSDLKAYSWPITVTHAGSVLDVNVTVDITHPSAGELEVYLISPSGRRVELFTGVGGTGDNFRVTTLDDEALTPITAGTAPFNGTFRPEGLLSAFDGEPAQGTWRLEIRDGARPNKGKLNSWSLTITRGVGPALGAAEAPPAGHAAPAATLTAADVQPLLPQALARWQASGADTSALAGLSVRIADLGGTTLGMVSGNTIWLDDDAAGWGWFVDPTPWDDREFTTPGDQGEQNRMDLLSVLMHEIGHVLGHDHDDGGGVMNETLAAGERLTLSGVFVDRPQPIDVPYVFGDEFDPLAARRNRR